MDAQNLNWIEKPQMEKHLDYSIKWIVPSWTSSPAVRSPKTWENFQSSGCGGPAGAATTSFPPFISPKKTQIQATPDRKNPNPRNPINASKIPFWVYKNHSLETKPVNDFRNPETNWKKNEKGKSNCRCRFQSNHRELGKKGQFPCASQNFLSLKVSPPVCVLSLQKPFFLSLEGENWD